MQFKRAGFYTRLFAFMYDLFLLIGSTLAIIFIFIAILQPVYSLSPLLIQAIIILTFWGYFIINWYYLNQTLGMKTWKIKLNFQDEPKNKFFKLNIRFLLGLISFLSLGLGLIFILWKSDKLTWYDYYSKTEIIYT